MKTVEYHSDNNQFKSDDKLTNRLNADLNYCGLSEPIQKGFLFFMGAAIVAEVNESGLDLREVRETEDSFIEFMYKTVSLYSKSTGDFSDYGELNDGVFIDYIYNTAYVINTILLNSKTSIADSQLNILYI